MGKVGKQMLFLEQALFSISRQKQVLKGMEARSV